MHCSRLVALVFVLGLIVAVVESCCSNSCNSGCCNSCVRTCRSSRNSDCCNSCAQSCNSCSQTCDSNNCKSKCADSQNCSTVTTTVPQAPQPVPNQSNRSSNTNLKADEKATAESNNRIDLKAEVNSTFGIHNSLTSTNDINIPINITNQNQNNIHIQMESPESSPISYTPTCTTASCAPQTAEKEIVVITQPGPVHYQQVPVYQQIRVPYPVREPYYVQMPCPIVNNKPTCQQQQQSQQIWYVPPASNLVTSNVSPCGTENCISNPGSTCCQKYFPGTSGVSTNLVGSTMQMPCTMVNNKLTCQQQQSQQILYAPPVSNLVTPNVNPCGTESCISNPGSTCCQKYFAGTSGVSTNLVGSTMQMPCTMVNNKLTCQQQQPQQILYVPPASNLITTNVSPCGTENCITNPGSTCCQKYIAGTSGVSANNVGGAPIVRGCSPWCNVMGVPSSSFCSSGCQATQQFQLGK